MTMKGELRSAQVVYGAPFVMISGDLWMLKWSVGNWDTQQTVKREYSIQYSIVKCLFYSFY